MPPGRWRLNMAPLEPSIPLLIIKTILAFVICWAAGWAIRTRSFDELFDNVVAAWIVTLTLGAAFLGVSTYTGVLLNLTGVESLAFPAMAFVVRLCLALRRTGLANLVIPAPDDRKAHLVFILLSALAAASYLAPFIATGTSGFYARGGGDASNYINISDYAARNRFWTDIDGRLSYPPYPDYIQKASMARQQEMKSEYGYFPMVNQMIFAPFMSALPGDNIEDYTAATAMYMTVMGWGYAALVATLAGGGAAFLLVAAPVILFSNMTMFAATTGANGVMLGCALLTAALAYYTRLIRTNGFSSKGWQGHALLLSLLSGALFIVYPHMFALGLVLLAAMLMALYRSSEYFKLARFILLNAFGALLVSNMLAYFNIGVIYVGATFSRDYGSSVYNLLDVFACQSGWIDFITLLGSGNSVDAVWFAFGVAGTAVSLASACYALTRMEKRARNAAAALLLILTAAIAYFSFPKPSFHVFRLTEIAQPLLAALSGAGISFLILRGKTSRWMHAGYALLAVMLTCIVAHRAYAVRHVVKSPTDWQVSYYDAEKMGIVNRLARMQACNDRGCDRVIYYFGSGYGVEVSGVSAILRSTSYLLAHGYTYAQLLDKRNGGPGMIPLWDEGYLEDSLLIVSEQQAGDIITDKRSDAPPPIEKSTFWAVYDTQSQSVARLVGDSWNAPSPYAGGVEGPHTFRYLRGRPGVLVMWSVKEANAKLSLKFYADRDGARLAIEGKPMAETVTAVADRWTGDYKAGPSAEIDLRLRKGPNVVLFTPCKTEDGALPWFLFFDVSVG